VAKITYEVFQLVLYDVGTEDVDEKVQEWIERFFDQECYERILSLMVNSGPIQRMLPASEEDVSSLVATMLMHFQLGFELGRRFGPRE
jgi:hypothetical protein